MKKPKFFFFDLGKVLLEFDHRIACQNIGGLCNRSEDFIQKLIFESDLQSRYENGELSSREFHKHLCRLTGVEMDFQQLCIAASAIFRPNFSIFPIVTQLAAAGKKLGILSNTCDAHWQYAINGRYRILNDLFDNYQLSFEARCSKPDREFYDRAIESTGFEPGEIFFVDDRSENVEGARIAGMDAVLYTDAAKLTRDLVQRSALSVI